MRAQADWQLRRQAAETLASLAAAVQARPAPGPLTQAHNLTSRSAIKGARTRSLSFFANSPAGPTKVLHAKQRRRSWPLNPPCGPPPRLGRAGTRRGADARAWHSHADPSRPFHAPRAILTCIRLHTCIYQHVLAYLEKVREHMPHVTVITAAPAEPAGAQAGRGRRAAAGGLGGRRRPVGAQGAGGRRARRRQVRQDRARPAGGALCELDQRIAYAGAA